MKQLLIVDGSKALNYNSATFKDLSVLDKGAICFFTHDGATLDGSVAVKKNFGIALGRGNNSPAFVIPEVDIETLKITKALPKAGVAFTTTITCPDVTVGENITLVIAKLGTVFNERNTWTITIPATASGSTMDDADVALALKKAINDKAAFGGIDVTASVGTSTNANKLTIAGNVKGEGFTVKLADALSGATKTETKAQKTIGDKAYISDIARQCAAGKGFNSLYGEGKELYPGFPEYVADLVPNTSGTAGASTVGYVLYNLHFATGRAAGKQLDERVWQDVMIAVPLSSTEGNVYGKIDTILGQPVLVNEDAEAAASAGSGT